jgi:RNA polymerase sigma factor (sigma-70 family)
MTTETEPTSSASRPATGDAPANGVFVTTRWSLVLKAGRPDSSRSRAALEQLCRSYWHPLYHYVRRRGYRPEDAQDLTQSFFARLLERDSLAHADPKRGRFRSFLLASLKNFLGDEWDKARARKRGGGQAALSLDFETEERQLSLEPADPRTPESVFERRWAIALLDQVYRRLETEFASVGKAGQFAALRVTLTAPRGSTPYAELAGRLGMSEGAVKVAVHRLRQRYRALLRDTIADTVSGPEEVEDELRHLLQVLAG